MHSIRGLFLVCVVITCSSVCLADVHDDMKRLNMLITENHNPSIPPSQYVGDPTMVEVNAYINSLGSISAASMDFSVDIFLREVWHDKRLALNSMSLDHLTLSTIQDINKIWKPGLYFKNVKESHFHTVTKDNTYLFIYSDGKILSSMRLTMKLSCQMYLHNYPQDIQHCYIKIASYAYPDSAVKLKWGEDLVQISGNLEIPEFKLTEILPKREPCVDHYITGNFSCLEAKITLNREYRYHVIQTYAPTVFIVMISWVSCWLDPGAIPARVTLGVTTLLTLTTLASGVRARLPPVSYIKAIDVWMGTCMVFVFAALLEFTVVNYLFRRKTLDGKDYVTGAKKVDRISRIFFPVTFFLFVIVYWPVYTN